MCSGGDTRALPRVGCPIRRSAGHRLFSTSPRLIAAVHVLRRLLTPRHPPRALRILTIEHTYLPLCSFQGTRPIGRERSRPENSSFVTEGPSAAPQPAGHVMPLGGMAPGSRRAPRGGAPSKLSSMPVRALRCRAALSRTPAWNRLRLRERDGHGRDQVCRHCVPGRARPAARAGGARRAPPARPARPEPLGAERAAPSLERR